MSQELKNWLTTETEAICQATLYRAPNMLPEAPDLAEFLRLLISNLTVAREQQLSAVQFWALTSIGHDAPFAGDWVTILRVLKEEIVKALRQAFPAETALRAWMLLDDVFIYALIEVTQLASDVARAEMLEHMVQLRRQMEAIEQTKTNFIAVAAHELKTPLTIMEGYSNMMRSEIDRDSNLRLFLEGLDNGTRRMHEIIADMIDVSLIDLKTIQLKYQQFYLEKVILMAADKCDRFFAQRRVELIIMPLPVEKRIFGDPELLVKAFMKVLLNGLKYTPDGGRVTVSSTVTRSNEADDRIAGYIDVQITDTGIGIDPQNFELIFRKFTSLSDVSLHSSSKTKFKGGGPGLGLPIARGIVEAHGGRIWVVSAGHDEQKCPGSTFHLEIPMWIKRPDAFDPAAW